MKWSIEHEQWLRENYINLSIETCMDYLGRSRRQILKKASRMHIRKLKIRPKKQKELTQAEFLKQMTTDLITDLTQRQNEICSRLPMAYK